MHSPPIAAHWGVVGGGVASSVGSGFGVWVPLHGLHPPGFMLPNVNHWNPKWEILFQFTN